ncbi:MAG: SRPBCC domain-containing protein [Leptospiraceae bacterium]|nr:SRPBCC domain-containing protein [Leptospiraceae bacterium]
MIYQTIQTALQKIRWHTRLRSWITWTSLLALFLPGACKSVYTQTAIKASPAEIWSALMANQCYPEWNPYHVRVEGFLQEGNTILVEIHKPNGSQITIHPRVLRIEPQRLLVWGGGIPGLFTGEHVFEIIERDTEVLFVQREEFYGLFVLFAELETIEEGYTQMNAALKVRLENRPIPNCAINLQSIHALP